MRAFQTGDQEAFNLICPPIWRAVYVRAGKMGLDPDESEDIAQKVLVRVYLYAPRAEFGSKGQLWSWIYTIASREIYKHWKRKRPEIVSEDVLEVLYHEQPTDPSHDPAVISAEDETLRDAGECIGRLEDAERLCLLGPLVGGLTFRQAAAVHGLSLGQLKHRYEKAMDKVRDCMRSKGHDIQRE